MAGKHTAVVVLCLLACACEPIQTAPQPEWERAPKEYVCTVEQMKRVESEAKFCDENTSYFSSYCYGSAFMRNCTKRGATQPLPPPNEENES